jgi:hypothetical protein
MFLIFSAFIQSSLALLSEYDIEHCDVQRLQNPSFDEFERACVKAAVPCILVDEAAKWPASTRWSLANLSTELGHLEVFVSGLTVDDDTNVFMRDYIGYVLNNNDYDPAYLFDNAGFSEGRYNDIVGDFDVPSYFPDDYLRVLNSDRPPYIWLLIGSERTNSHFHIDPHNTSAWNALLVGAKRWMLYPPHISPPGFPVLLSEYSNDDFRAEDSIIDWIDAHYNRSSYYAPIECVQRKDEIIYVPSGWWHAVLNIEHSVAITQNFVDRYNLEMYLTELRASAVKDEGVFD